MKALVFAILIYLFFTASVYHPVHISYTKVEVQSNKVLMLVKIFSDDLQLSAQTFFAKQTISESEYVQYVLQHCKVLVNGQICAFSLQTKKNDDTTDWFYFITTLPSNDCAVELHNNILCNVYEDQKNLVIISCNSEEKGFSLDYTNRICNF